MKRMNVKRVLGVVAIATLFAVGACKTSSTEDPDTTNGDRASESENVVQDGVNTAQDGYDGSVDGVPSNGRSTACATVTYDVASKTVAIDFGTGGCTGVDGRIRSGKISIQFAGTREVPSSRSITFTNYTVGGSSLNGSITQSTIVKTDSLHYSSSLASTGLTVVLSDGKTYTLNSYQRTLAVNLGATVRNIKDDVSTLTGSSSMTNSTNVTTTVTITAPITFNGTCTSTGIYYPSSGTYEIKEGNLTYTLDWGTAGTCDKNISITVFGKTTIKTLP